MGLSLRRQVVRIRTRFDILGRHQARAGLALHRSDSDSDRTGGMPPTDPLDRSSAIAPGRQDLRGEAIGEDPGRPVTRHQEADRRSRNWPADLIAHLYGQGFARPGSGQMNRALTLNDPQL